MPVSAQQTPALEIESPRVALRLQSHVGAEAISRIRSEWERLQHHPNSDFDHYLLVCQLRSEVLHPWALSVWEGNHCRAIVAGRLEQNRLRPQLGYASLPGISVRQLAILHEGILGELDDDASEAVLAAFLQNLEQGLADMVGIHALPEAFTGVWAALRSRSRQTLGVVSPVWTIHRGLILPEEPGFLLKNMRSKHRSWIKRKERELSLAFPNQIQWSWHKDIVNHPDLRRRIEAVAHSTYQRGLNAGFVDNEEMRQRLALFATRGQTRVSLLEIAGVPKAFWLGTVYRGIFYSGATGYTPDMRPFEVGTAMFLRLADELARESIERLDFGLGDAEYKERFGNYSRREANVQLFGNTAQSRLLQAYLGGTDILNKLARRTIQHLGLFAWVKQAWRARLRKQADATQSFGDN